MLLRVVHKNLVTRKMLVHNKSLDSSASSSARTMKRNQNKHSPSHLILILLPAPKPILILLQATQILTPATILAHKLTLMYLHPLLLILLIWLHADTTQAWFR